VHFYNQILSKGHKIERAEGGLLATGIEAAKVMAARYN
jgi:hypothetical protein